MNVLSGVGFISENNQGHEPLGAAGIKGEEIGEPSASVSNGEGI